MPRDSRPQVPRLDLHDIKNIITRSRSFFAARRVWHLRRFARRTGMQTDLRRYYTAVTMVYACPVPSALRLTHTFQANSLESGAILCAWLVAPSMTWRVFCGGFAQSLNIVPKMDVVRVRSGNIYSFKGTWYQNEDSEELLGPEKILAIGVSLCRQMRFWRYGAFAPQAAVGRPKKMFSHDPEAAAGGGMTGQPRRRPHLCRQPLGTQSGGEPRDGRVPPVPPVTAVFDGCWRTRCARRVTRRTRQTGGNGYPVDGSTRPVPVPAWPWLGGPDGRVKTRPSRPSTRQKRGRVGALVGLGHPSNPRNRQDNRTDRDGHNPHGSQLG
ncbi:hypothetical protein B0H19DRAFT_1085857 [Mycena capillaripes]|nr:hypothetical protein B0H19DRAFT_1085857 [Mycena capillaripes]